MELIDELLENQKCICGNPIHKNSESYNKLLELKNNYSESDYKRFYEDFYINLKILKESKKSKKDRISKILKDINESKDDREKILIQIETLEEKLNNLSSEKLSNLDNSENTLKSFKKDLINNEAEIQNLEKEMKILKIKKTDLLNEIEKLEKEEKEIKNLSIKKNI
ncbi:hypothetical protein OF820_06235 [Oceanotoga sp. DSM 15011]|uniref:hypothetical protein n=1 Tax=Oceanotoga sp. DSM 15011 TaxID=2984951 RepID=UPI0021F4B003|nr:hypothetical protein [Oceanotoga sp. DSM 15011]UYP01283.1 hypothetical protein OF820_06235 [Oceanotoga sp. DSM 15011]